MICKVGFCEISTLEKQIFLKTRLYCFAHYLAGLVLKTILLSKILNLKFAGSTVY